MSFRVFQCLPVANRDNRALTTFENSPRIYKRFVDDIVSVIKRENLEQFHNHINTLHPKIQLTIEEESDVELPFLDTLLKRKPDGTISILVYRKPTHTDQYLNYNSNHPVKTKDAVVSALFKRAKEIISDKGDLEKENERIVKVLCDNDFKKSDITKVKKKIRSSSPYLT